MINLVIKLYFKHFMLKKKENSEVTYIVFADENRKFSALSLMSGYIDLLGNLSTVYNLNNFPIRPITRLSRLKKIIHRFCITGSDINHLLMSASHLKRLSLSLVQVFELDTTDIKIIEERTTWIGHGKTLPNTFYFF